jgi:Domain of unknown function (DUF2017)
LGSIRRRGGHVRIRLDADEAGFLIALSHELITLLSDTPKTAGQPDAGDPLEALAGAFADPVEPPEDAALQRILPDAYQGDDEAAAEFRRLTDSGLRSAKRLRLEHLIESLSNADPPGNAGVRLDLDDAEVEEWLFTLTDVRLMFGTWINATEDLDDERTSVAPGTKRHAEIEAYDWLASLQETLVHALTGD